MTVKSSAGSVAGKHPVDQVLPFGQMFVYGLQHVLSMYAGVVAVPLIVGTALKLSGPEITYLVSAVEAPIFAEGPAMSAISDEDEARLDNEGSRQHPTRHDAGQARRDDDDLPGSSRRPEQPR